MQKPTDEWCTTGRPLTRPRVRGATLSSLEEEREAWLRRVNWEAISA